jgi:cation:H+ antiporter
LTKYNYNSILNIKGGNDMSFILLLVGFIFLIKGADYFVEGSSNIAKKFKISPMIIGLTIVALGTSMPELSVSITSSLIGKNDMSLANVVGSNMFNILMALGTSSLIINLPIEKNSIKFDIPFLIGIGILLLLMLFDLKLSIFEGLILIGIFVFYLWKTLKPMLKKRNKDIKENEEKNKSMFKMIVISLVGIIGIIIGGDMVVDNASKIAEIFGMSQNLIGLTIVAVGTSLPEFVTSIMAIKKGENEIAIGNVVGSNIFNILLILGVSSVVNPLIVNIVGLIDVLFMIASSVLLYLFVRKNKNLNRYQGITFILLYVGYIIYTIIR